MSMASAAKEAAIIQMMSGFPSSSKITDANVDAYLAALEEFSAEAVKAACVRFSKGQVPGRDNAFMPTAAEVSLVAQTIHLEIRENELFKLYGPSSYVDFGPGRIEERGLSKDQRDMLYRLGGKLPDGPNGTPGTYLGRLTIEQRQQVLTKKAIAALENGTPLHKVLNLPAPERIPVPRLRKV